MKHTTQLFFRIVLVEIAKLKGTFAFWLSLLYPSGTVLLVTLFWISMRNQKGANNAMFIDNLGNVASFFLPFFIVLMISVACNIEHKSSLLKHLLVLPVPRPLFYTGKFAGIMLFIFLAFLLTLIFTYISLFFCGLASPKLGFGADFNHLLLLRVLLRAYVAASAIYSIQYWFGMKLRNLTLPVAIGSALIILPIAIMIILGISGLITNSDDFSKIISYNPYSFPFSTVFNLMKNKEVVIFSNLSLTFIALSSVVLISGAWQFNKRNIV